MKYIFEYCQVSFKKETVTILDNNIYINKFKTY